ncbi:MAG: hypothetical protein WKF76_08330 [Nocardioidaceae bacterium]
MTHDGHDPGADAATEHRFELVMSVVVVVRATTSADRSNPAERSRSLRTSSSRW